MDKLPVELGQEVWVVHYDELCLGEITKIEFNLYTNPKVWIEVEFASRTFGNVAYKHLIGSLIGKTVFLTREEAEEKLKELEGK